MHYRTAQSSDLFAIINLYKEVAKNGGKIVRNESEITEAYVKDFLEKSIEDGLCIVGEHPEDSQRLVGCIHAYTLSPKVFHHVYSHLTIVVDPTFQSKKIGTTLFTIFLEEIARYRTKIGRVELMVRESNTRAIQFYRQLGFKIEGRFEMRIKNTDGSYEADIPMAWQNPMFEFD
jgi:ribosomal protein S18 acetylase RimI-like enzyme